MENLWIAIAIGFAVLVVLLLLLRSGGKKGDANNTAADTTRAPQPFTGNVAPAQPAAPAADTFAGGHSNIPTGNFEAEVRMLIDYGNKAEAMRIVREKLGLDLKDAKDLVERMENGEPLQIESAIAPIDQEKDPDFDVRQLAQSGRLIEAIKLVRERKGLDLKAAKAYVERL